MSFGVVVSHFQEDGSCGSPVPWNGKRGTARCGLHAADGGDNTWPLAASLTTRVPGDFGDPLFIGWVMSWVSERCDGRDGDPSSLRAFWDAPIFRPETGALTFPSTSFRRRCWCSRSTG